VGFYVWIAEKLQVLPFVQSCRYCTKIRSIRFVTIVYYITITILYIIHRPVFYLKLNPTLQVCPYLTGNTLRLRYEPNRLMLPIGSWRLYINTTITILNIIHRPAFYLKLNSTLYVCPYFSRKHITSPLRAQQVNAIYRFVTMVY
jgi:hypothetical protein